MSQPEHFFTFVIKSDVVPQSLSLVRLTTSQTKVRLQTGAMNPHAVLIRLTFAIILALVSPNFVHSGKYNSKRNINNLMITKLYVIGYMIFEHYISNHETTLILQTTLQGLVVTDLVTRLMCKT